MACPVCDSLHTRTSILDHAKSAHGIRRPCGDDSDRFLRASTPGTPPRRFTNTERARRRSSSGGSPRRHRTPDTPPRRFTNTERARRRSSSGGSPRRHRTPDTPPRRFINTERARRRSSSGGSPRRHRTPDTPPRRFINTERARRRSSSGGSPRRHRTPDTPPRRFINTERARRRSSSGGSPRRHRTPDTPPRRFMNTDRSRHRSSSGESSLRHKTVKRSRHDERSSRRNDRRSSSRERSRRSSHHSSEDLWRRWAERRSPSPERPRRDWPPPRSRHRSASVESTFCFPMPSRRRHRSASVESTFLFPMPSRRHRSASVESTFCFPMPSRQRHRSASVESTRFPERSERRREPTPPRSIGLISWYDPLAMLRSDKQSLPASSQQEPNSPPKRSRGYAPQGRLSERYHDDKRDASRSYSGNDRSRRHQSGEDGHRHSSADRNARNQAKSESSRRRSRSPEDRSSGKTVKRGRFTTAAKCPDSDTNAQRSDEVSRSRKPNESTSTTRPRSPSSPLRKKQATSYADVSSANKISSDDPSASCDSLAEVSGHQTTEKKRLSSSGKPGSCVPDVASDSKASERKNSAVRATQLAAKQDAVPKGTPAVILRTPAGTRKEDEQRTSTVTPAADDAETKPGSTEQSTPKQPCDSPTPAEKTKCNSVANAKQCSKDDERPTLSQNHMDDKKSSGAGCEGSKLTSLNREVVKEQSQSSSPGSLQTHPKTSKPQLDEQLRPLPSKKQPEPTPKYQVPPNAENQPKPAVSHKKGQARNAGATDENLVKTKPLDQQKEKTRNASAINKSLAKTRVLDQQKKTSNVTASRDLCAETTTATDWQDSKDQERPVDPGEAKFTSLNWKSVREEGQPSTPCPIQIQTKTSKPHLGDPVSATAQPKPTSKTQVSPIPNAESQPKPVESRQKEQARNVRATSKKMAKTGALDQQKETSDVTVSQDSLAGTGTATDEQCSRDGMGSTSSKKHADVKNPSSVGSKELKLILNRVQLEEQSKSSPSCPIQIQPKTSKPRLDDKLRSVPAEKQPELTSESHTSPVQNAESRPKPAESREKGQIGNSDVINENLAKTRAQDKKRETSNVADPQGLVAATGTATPRQEERPPKRSSRQQAKEQVKKKKKSNTKLIQVKPKKVQQGKPGKVKNQKGKLVSMNKPTSTPKDGTSDKEDPTLDSKELKVSKPESERAKEEQASIPKAKLNDQTNESQAADACTGNTVSESQPKEERKQVVAPESKEEQITNPQEDQHKNQTKESLSSDACTKQGGQGGDNESKASSDVPGDAQQNDQKPMTQDMVSSSSVDESGEAEIDGSTHKQESGKEAGGDDEAAEEGKVGDSKPSGSIALPTQPGTITHRCSLCPAVLASWFELRKHENFCPKKPLPGFGQASRQCPSCERVIGNVRHHRTQCRAQCARCGKIGLHNCFGKHPAQLPAARGRSPSRGRSPVGLSPFRPVAPRPESFRAQGPPQVEWAVQDPDSWCPTCGRWGHVCRQLGPAAPWKPWNSPQRPQRPQGAGSQACARCGARGMHLCFAQMQPRHPGGRGRGRF